MGARRGTCPDTDHIFLLHSIISDDPGNAGVVCFFVHYVVKYLYYIVNESYYLITYEQIYHKKNKIHLIIFCRAL